MKIRALAVLLPLLALTGCTEDNNVSVQVYGICAPPDAECSFTGECEAYTLAPFALDVGVTDHHWTFIEVHNQTLNNANGDTGQGNTHDAYVEVAEIEYETPGLPAGTVTTPVPSVADRLESGPMVVPAEGTAVVGLYPITRQVGQILAARINGGTAAQRAATYDVIARVRLRGFYADQSEFETAEFPLRIRVCVGCITVFGCDDPATPEIEPTAFCPPNPGQAPLSVICGG
jgi:hypothetical protein